MARPSNKDPLDRFRWTVEIEGFTRLGFTSVETPSVAIGTKDYPEGGSHLFPRKIVDRVEYRPITLTRGVTSDLNFQDWTVGYIELVQNRRTRNQGEDPTDYRRDVILKHKDRAGRTIKTYTLYNAIPVEYKPASDFAADGDDVLSMEKLVLAYESFDVVSAEANLQPFSAKDVVKRLVRRVF